MNAFDLDSIYDAEQQVATLGDELARLLAHRLDMDVATLRHCPITVMLDLAKDDTTLYAFLRKQPEVIAGLKQDAQEKRSRAQQARRFAAQVRAAQKTAKDQGVTCWAAVLESPELVKVVRTAESAMADAGWAWIPVNEPFAAEWRVRFEPTGAEHALSWAHLQENIEVLTSNPAVFRFRTELGKRRALELALSSRTSPKVLPGIAASIAVVTRHLPDAVPHLSASAWRALARAPEELRWALLPEMARRPKAVGLRDLNWARFKEARQSRAVRWDAMPRSAQWEALTGLPAPVFALPPLKGLRIRTLRELTAAAGLAFDDQLVKNRGMLMPLLALTQLFGDCAAVRRFVHAAGYSWGQKGIHDAGQFKLPTAETWTPTKWAPLCLRHPKSVKYASEFAALERANLLPTCWADLQTVVLRRQYPSVPPELQGLLQLCLDYKLAPSVLMSAQAFWASAVVKPAEFMPQVRVRGEDVGLSPGWLFEKLAANDFMGPLLGHLTGCCQHLDGAGAACARHGVESPFSGFYVVTYRGRVLAQAWAWRTQEGGVVFDSIEGRALTADELQAVSLLFSQGVAQLLKGPLAVTSVFVGATDSGVTRTVLRHLPGPSPKKEYCQAPADACDYSDGSYHYLVGGRVRKKSAPYPAITGYTPSRRPAVKDGWLDHLQEHLLRERWSAEP